MSASIYLDHAATAPLAPGVAEVMHDVLVGAPGNPSSQHAEGRAACAHIDAAAEKVAGLIGAEPREIVWTSGATESSNLALRGVAEFIGAGARIVSVVTEHPATRDTLSALAKQGVTVDWLEVDAHGAIDHDALAASLAQGPDLVSIMQVNNETGVIHDVPAIAEQCAAAGVALHVDAAQSLGRLPIDVSATPIALMSLSAHKIGGPKGIGALYVRRRAPKIGVAAQIIGGGQQRGLRAGTLPTHQIAGFGAAAAQAARHGIASQPEWARLRERLWQGMAPLGGLLRNGRPETTAAPFLSVSVTGVHGAALITGLNEGEPALAVSTGAACSAAKGESSHVVRAMGRSPREAAATIRFSLGPGVDEVAIDAAAQRFRDEVRRLRTLAEAA
ncbi:cysteine desulfurase family protein [Salinisphaera hydrothermalis]|uniref:cysteine desulfurase family protein n=1 Tax=Salinisphaera hydrothermalis TaxID=563188 RepID=UPI0033403D25